MRKLGFLIVVPCVAALAGCGGSASPHAVRSIASASRPTPSPSPSPSSTRDVAVAWWNGSAHPALNRLQVSFQRFQQLAAQGKLDDGVCQALDKAGGDASAIGGSGIDALDSDWFPMAQHFMMLGSDCHAATLDVDSWDDMTNEMQLAAKDLLAFTGQLAKTLDVQQRDSA